MFMNISNINWLLFSSPNSASSSVALLQQQIPEQNFSPLAVILLVIASLDTIALTAVYLYYFHILETKFPTTMEYQQPQEVIEETVQSEEEVKSVDEIPPPIPTHSPVPHKRVETFSSSESVVADLRPFNPSVMGNYRPRSTILSTKYGTHLSKK